MARWKQRPGPEDTVSLRAFGASLAWILVLLGGYFLLSDWQALPALASSVLSLSH